MFAGYPDPAPQGRGVTGLIRSVVLVHFRLRLLQMAGADIRLYGAYILPFHDIAKRCISGTFFAVDRSRSPQRISLRIHLHP